MRVCVSSGVYALLKINPKTGARAKAESKKTLSILVEPWRAGEVAAQPQVAYENTACSGWRNWRVCGKEVYAQHPVEDWYVRVDARELLKAQLTESVPRESMAFMLEFCTKSGVAWAVPAHGRTAKDRALHPDVRFCEVTAKNGSNHFRQFISDVDIEKGLVRIATISRTPEVDIWVPWVKLLSECTVADTPFKLLEEWPYHLRTASDSREFYQAKILIDRDTNQLYTTGTRDLAPWEKKFEALLTAINFEISADTYADSYLGEGHFRFSSAQFVALLNNGCYVSPWMSPDKDVLGAIGGGSVQHIRVKLNNHQQPQLCVLEFGGKPGDTVSVRIACSGEDLVILTATSLTELSTYVKQWMLDNVVAVFLTAAYLELKEPNRTVQTIWLAL